MKTNPKTNPTLKTPSNTAPHTQHVRRVPTVVLLFLSLAALGFFLTACEEAQNSLQYTCTNGTAASGSTTSSQTEKCSRCNVGYYLTDANTCLQRGAYTCTGGTEKGGYTEDANDVEFCIECDDDHYLLTDSNTCSQRGVFTCAGGTKKEGYTEDADNREFCTKCNATHYLIMNRCEPRGNFTCTYGIARPGNTDDSNTEEHCVICNTGYWLTNANRCQPRGVFTCQNGTQKLGNTPEGTNIEFCTKCNSGHYLTGNRCEVLGVYTCTNGTKKEGHTTDGRNVEYCTQCNDGYFIDNTICKKTGEFFCRNGTKKEGNTQSGDDEEFCTECSPEYWLTNNRCDARGTYTCTNGTARTGYTEDSTYIEHCSECLPSHYLTDDNTCEPRGTYTCTNGTARTGYTEGSTNQEHCAECVSTHYLTNNNTCELRGTYTCQNGTAKKGYTEDANTIEYCTKCINSIFSLTNNQCLLPNTNFRPTILEGVCNQSSGFVPTTYNSSGISLNAKGVSVAGRAAQYKFTALTPIQQLECFTHAYPRENLPTKPTTTAAHRNTLPSGMLYAHSKYELIFEDTFTQSDTSTQVTSANPYDYTKVLDSTKWKVHVGGRAPYPTDTAIINKEHAWPVLIKDNKLYAGTPRVPVSSAPHTEHGECAYDEEKGGYYINGDLERGSCECDETRADFCAIFGISVHPLGSNGEFMKWRYGYLEIDLAQLYNGEYAWQCCRRALSQLELRRGGHSIQDWLNAQPQFSGAIPNFFNTISTAQKELSQYGVEFQIFEKYAFAHRTGASGWLVLHYNDAQRNVGLTKGRFYHTTSYSTGQLGRKITRKYGIEWTPKGYKIWFNDTAWRNSSGIKIFDRHDGNRDYHISHDGACDSAKKLDSDGFLQCGVSHALQDFLIRTDAFSITPTVENPYYIINSVRLWKPTNNYADIAPVYE